MKHNLLTPQLPRKYKLHQHHSSNPKPRFYTQTDINQNSESQKKQYPIIQQIVQCSPKKMSIKSLHQEKLLRSDRKKQQKVRNGVKLLQSLSIPTQNASLVIKNNNYHHNYQREYQIRNENLRLAGKLLFMKPSKGISKQQQGAFYRKQKSYQEIKLQPHKSTIIQIPKPHSLPKLNYFLKLLKLSSSIPKPRPSNKSSYAKVQ